MVLSNCPYWLKSIELELKMILRLRRKVAKKYFKSLLLRIFFALLIRDLDKLEDQVRTKKISKRLKRLSVS